MTSVDDLLADLLGEDDTAEAPVPAARDVSTGAPANSEQDGSGHAGVARDALQALSSDAAPHGDAAKTAGSLQHRPAVDETQHASNAQACNDTTLPITHSDPIEDDWLEDLAGSPGQPPAPVVQASRVTAGSGQTQATTIPTMVTPPRVSMLDFSDSDEESDALLDLEGLDDVFQPAQAFSDTKPTTPEALDHNVASGTDTATVQPLPTTHSGQQHADAPKEASELLDLPQLPPSSTSITPFRPPPLQPQLSHHPGSPASKLQPQWSRPLTASLSHASSLGVRLAPMHSLAMHEMLLQEAEAAERSLLTGTCPNDHGPPGDQVDALLAGARQDWPAQGRPDANGAMVGGSVALKLEEVLTAVPELAALLKQPPARAGTHGHPHLIRQASQMGTPRVISVQGPVVAVGTSQGAVLVAQLPTMAAAAAAATSGADGNTEGRARLPGSAPLMPASNNPNQQQATSTTPVLQLGEPKSDAEAVTALGFSRVDTAQDPLWVIVGHSSGTVMIWDLQRRPARCVTIISECVTQLAFRSSTLGRLSTMQSLRTQDAQHGLPVTHASFLPGRGVSLALTADRRGRLVSHTVATNMLLMRTTATSKPLLDGSLGIIASVSHLTPFPPPASLATNGEPAAGPVLVGDGVAALCTPTGCHVVRFRPGGDMVLLSAVPRPEGVRQGTIPVAAWCAHTRRSFTPAVMTGTVALTADWVESVSMPCACLAVAWGSTVLFCDVPLLGDHRNAYTGAPLADGSLTSAPLSSTQSVTVSQNMGAAAGAMGRSLLRSMTAAAAATASRATGTITDPLTPPVVKQLNAAFPIKVRRTWQTSSLDQERAAVMRATTATTAATDMAAGAATASPGQVLALHWYDGDALGVVVHQDLQMRLAVVGPDLEIREQVDCFDTPSASQHLTTTSSTVLCPETMAGQGSRMVLLGASGTMYCSRLMGWQERLRTLHDVGKLRLAIWYGLEFYKMHIARKHAAVAAGQAPATADIATAKLLGLWLLNLLAGYVQEGLGRAVPAAVRNQGWVEPEVQAECSRLARLSICLCLLLNQQQPLFQQLSATFQQAQWRLDKLPQLPPEEEDKRRASGLVRCGPLAAFLEALEPHILADRLPTLAPEVVQALVEQFAAGTADQPPQPLRVERCVLHLDVFSLDLDQVLKLCTTYGLYSALTYVYNRINEYRLPALELLACMAGLRPAPATTDINYLQPSPNLPNRSRLGALKAEALNPRVVAARKLLVYLRCIFRNQAFPPGSGPLLASVSVSGNGVGGADTGSELRAQLLGLLLFADVQDLSKEWRAPVSDIEQVVADPYPALRLLLEADAAATVSVLGEAVDGWDAVETELRAAAGKPVVEEMESVLVATQVLVNALVALMDPAPIPPTPNRGSVSSPHISSASRTATLDFITSLVTARRVTVQPQFVLQLLDHVLRPPAGSVVLQLPAAQHPAAAASRSGTATDLPAEFALTVQSPADNQPNHLQKPQRLEVHASGPAERLAICLLDVVGVNALDSARPAPDKMSPQESSQAIRTLQRHHMHLAAAHVHHMRGEVSQALSMHMDLEDSAAPFLYIHSCLHSVHYSHREALLAAVLAAVPRLAQCDATATAAALLAQGLTREQLHRLLGQLDSQPECKFQLLRALLALADRLAEEAKQQGDEEPEGDTPSTGAAVVTHLPITSTASSWSDVSAALDAPLVWLLLPRDTHALPRRADPRFDETTCNAYVELACTYAPAQVLPFLLQHAAYDVRHCLQAVKAAGPGARGAHAYLLERLGELHAAFQLHLSHIQETNRALEGLQGSSDHGAAVQPPAGPRPASAVGSGPQHGAQAQDVQLVVWLLALSSRLSTVLPQMCGPTTWQAAAAAAQQGQTQQPPQQPRPQQAAPKPVAGRSRFASAAAPLPGTPSTAAQEGSAVPPQIQAFWAALVTACGFCQRVSRVEKQRGLLQAARAGVPPDTRGSAVGQAAQQILNAEAGGRAPNTGGRASKAADEKRTEAASSYWLQLLEVYLREMRAVKVSSHPFDFPASLPSSSTTPQSSSAATPTAFPTQGIRGLKLVFAVAAEEVVAHAADHMQLSELVRHVSIWHGAAAVGEFRSILSGLLSACTYEQAIMEAAQRLLAHDALAHVRACHLQHAKHLPPTEVTTAAGSSYPAAEDAGPTGIDLASSSSTGTAFRLVSDMVHGGILASAGAAHSSRRQAAGSRAAAGGLLVLDGSRALDSGEVAAGTGLSARPVWQGAGTRRQAGHGATDFQLLRAADRTCVKAGVRLAEVRRSLGLAPPLRSVTATTSGPTTLPFATITTTAPLPSAALWDSFTPDTPCTPEAGLTQHVAGAAGAGRTLGGKDSFDLDHLLNWAADASGART